jgi:uncharacterized protein (TIGR00730 family)
MIRLKNKGKTDEKMKAICVYCGSASGAKAVYYEAAKRLGETLAEREITLVYGGAQVGLMGTVAEGCLQAGGKVIGVIPRFFMDTPQEKLLYREIVHQGLTELHLVETMHERKAKMATLADGFIALPGGFGTLDEVFEILTWAQLDLHQKPVGFLNTGGFFDPLSQFLDHIETEGFLHTHHRRLPLFDREIPPLLEQMGL